MELFSHNPTISAYFFCHNAILLRMYNIITKDANYLRSVLNTSLEIKHNVSQDSKIVNEELHAAAASSQQQSKRDAALERKVFVILSNLS